MKIEVAKPDLEAALQVASIGISKSINPLTSHFIFRYQQDDNSIEVLSNSGRQGCSMPLQGANISLDGDHTMFTVEAWRLNKWIAAVEDAVLTLEYKDGVIKATSPKGSVKFQSLDASEFSFWDKSLSEATEGVGIEAKRFQAALNHVKMFIADTETTAPKLSVTEITDGSLRSTDKGSLAEISLEGFEKSNLRLGIKDLGPVMAFLGHSKSEEVTLREGDNALFVVRHDGGTLTVTRPQYPFPAVVMPSMEDPQHYWILRKDQVVSAIQTAIASAAREDHQVYFKLVKDGVVGVSMKSASGELVTLHLETQGSTVPGGEGEEDIKISGDGSREDAVPIPDDGFPVPYPYLLKVLGQWKGDEVKFVITPRIDPETKAYRGGYVQFAEKRGEDNFLSLIVWSS